jgi:hypothetical protein
MSITQVSAEEQRLIDLAQKNSKFTQEELVIPRLKILQPLNPELSEGGPQYVENAKPGMFYNTNSGKLTSGKTGMTVTIIGHQRNYVEWVPRQNGGGLVKVWGQDEGWRNNVEPEKQNDWQPVTKNGNIIAKVRTFLLFDIDTETGEYDPSFMGLQGTQTRVASAVCSMLMQSKMKIAGKVYTAPFYFYTYKMTLDTMRNEKGSWFVPRIVKNVNEEGMHVRTTDLPNGEAIFQDAINMQEQFMEGTILQQSFDDQPAIKQENESEDKLQF